MANIYEIIEELEKEFGDSKNFMWSKKSLVDLKKCSELLDELKRNLPEAVAESTYLLSQKEKIIAEAKRNASEIEQQAETRVETMITQSNIVKKAEKQAQEIISQAETKRKQIIEGTQSNIDKMLKGVEDYLTDNLRVVRNNREELAGGTLKKPKL